MKELSIIITLQIVAAHTEYIDSQIKGHFSQSSHTNNWAVLVCASRYWFNYRHIANTLAVYRSVKQLGIPDSQIMLFLADDMACNGRNADIGAVYNHKNKLIDLYGNDVEVDFRGEEVTVENLVRLLTGRQDKDTPRSRRLGTNSKSNVLFYLTGHGGENFLKFQDDEEISAKELSDAFEQMKQKERFNELLFIIDTCQGESMIRSTYTEGFVGFASSKVGEDSLSHHVDHDLGVYMVDRFTYHLLEFLEKVKPDSEELLSTMKRVCPPSLCISTPVNKFDLLKPRRQKSAKVVDFFGSERSAIFTELEKNNTSAVFTELNENQPFEIKTRRIASLADTIKEIKSITKKTENAYLYEKRYFVVILTIFALISALI
ncbi:unnamed protein product [Oikopleura dioica]|uniref:GPI-anchor transamidase n=1 Tax=Oikopleura dioica TaxID=34765 RepID=E4XGX1_OIKDI|nr:unnamed protein product [Oikopleura dioica]